MPLFSVSTSSRSQLTVSLQELIIKTLNMINYLPSYESWSEELRLLLVLAGPLPLLPP